MKTLVDGVKNSDPRRTDVLDLRSPERRAILERRQQLYGDRQVVKREAASLSSLNRRLTQQPAPPAPKRPLRWFPLVAGLVFAPIVMVITTLAMTKPAPTPTAATPKPATAVASTAKEPEPKTPPAPAVDAALQNILDTFRQTQATPYGIWVKNLASGQINESNSAQIMTSASFYKLFVASEILKQVDAGSLSLTAAAGGGTNRNIRDCLKVMIDVSDNPCGRALGTRLGWGRRNAALKQQGFVGTSLTQPQKTTGADVGLWFDKLHSGQLLSPTSSELLLGFLKNQKVNNRLPKGMPLGTVFAHKTGDLDGYIHDGGIVYHAGKPYIVVVMSGPHKTPANGATQFIKLSQQLWAHFSL
jgi:beta-lactamase class A